MGWPGHICYTYPWLFCIFSEGLAASGFWPVSSFAVQSFQGDFIWLRKSHSHFFHIQLVHQGLLAGKCKIHSILIAASGRRIKISCLENNCAEAGGLLGAFVKFCRSRRINSWISGFLPVLLCSFLAFYLCFEVCNWDKWSFSTTFRWKSQIIPKYYLYFYYLCTCSAWEVTNLHKGRARGLLWRKVKCYDDHDSSHEFIIKAGFITVNWRHIHLL